ncbi:EAL domain-containing protein [Ilyobacter polytropus]|uniref:EAL domain-containing protein n=1 Tax=Ilyobacter polytropus (strain ATCC 51220 / DSM 2926 / LMG 16218 / CuHBu1) TaxID=572544 RepID=E3HCG8_ILYPC|nr:EAL domain-containing protein [Ilyobacter polytropus]ADO83944.1 hypothetical protein Ilyop_2181 [Ilyobacter polytropus DSM 2926]
MEKNNYYQRAFEKVEFKFIPVYYLKTGKIYGYKIIKDFSKLGFEDKNEMYEMVAEENYFEFFILKIKEKAMKLAKEKGYLDKKLFYTLRVNYINDSEFLFASIETMLKKYNLNKENICFELKGFKSWNDVEELLEYRDEGYDLLFKETAEAPISTSLISYTEPDMVEIMNLEEKELIKLVKKYGGKIIYKIPDDKPYDKKDLSKLGINFIYKK